MKPANKIKLANLSTWTMVITICFIALFFIGHVTTVSFDLNVLTKRTSEFIFSFIGFSAVLVLCSAILNISLNIGLIADSKTQEIKDTEASFISRKWMLYMLGFLVAFVALLFLGDYLTRQNEKNKIIREANDVINRYSGSIQKISAGLTDTSKVHEIPEILRFLASQKQYFPSIRLITSDQFDGQLTFLEISNGASSQQLKTPYFGNSFYKCEAQDCDYLEKYFTGKTTDSHFWTHQNDYKLYFPFNENNRKFILVFSRVERHGSVGSGGIAF